MKSYVCFALVVALTACGPIRMTNVESFRTYPDGRVSEMMETSLRQGGAKVRLQIIYKKPEGSGPFPLLLLNHGSTRGSTAGGSPDRASVPTYYDTIVEYFVRHGWMVAVPQRRGRGWSDGLYDEGLNAYRTGYTCDSTPALWGVERALTDIGAALDVLVARPEVDGSRVVMAGVSRGGMTSVAFAGNNPTRVQGVINFVGGWVSEGCQNATAIHGALAREGAAFPKPMLWLYSRDDWYYSIRHSRSHFDRFIESGGMGEFIVTGTGHDSWRDLSNWHSYVATYMNSLGYSEF